MGQGFVNAAEGSSQSFDLSDKATSGDIKTGDQITSSGGDAGWKMGLVKSLAFLGIGLLALALLRKGKGKA